MGVRFFGVFFFLLFEDEHRQNVPSGRRGEEKWLYSHGKTLVKFIQIHWQLEILHISCRLEVSPSDFDNILRLLLSVGFCRKSQSLVNFIDQYYDLFFSCTSQVEIAISRCFQDRILRRVTRTSGPCCRLPPNPYFFWLRHLKLYYHANQIWHVCNNLLDAMVHWVPYDNCFSGVDKTRNTKHSRTCRNIPEHPGTWKDKNNFHKKNYDNIIIIIK